MKRFRFLTLFLIIFISSFAKKNEFSEQFLKDIIIHFLSNAANKNVDTERNYVDVSLENTGNGYVIQVLMLDRHFLRNDFVKTEIIGDYFVGYSKENFRESKDSSTKILPEEEYDPSEYYFVFDKNYRIDPYSSYAIDEKSSIVFMYSIMMKHFGFERIQVEQAYKGDTLIHIEKAPQYKFGKDSLIKLLNKECLKRNINSSTIQRTVYRITVSTDGKAVGVKNMSDTDNISFENCVIESILGLNSFIPGIHRNNFVNSYYYLPIRPANF